MLTCSMGVMPVPPATMPMCFFTLGWYGYLGMGPCNDGQDNATSKRSNKGPKSETGCGGTVLSHCGLARRFRMGSRNSGAGEGKVSCAPHLHHPRMCVHTCPLVLCPSLLASCIPTPVHTFTHAPGPESTMLSKLRSYLDRAASI